MTCTHELGTPPSMGRFHRREFGRSGEILCNITHMSIQAESSSSTCFPTIQSRDEGSVLFLFNTASTVFQLLNNS